MAVASFPPSLVPVRSKPLSGYSSRSSCYYDSNLKEELLEILQDDFSRLRDLISNDRVTDTFWKSLFKHALQPVQEKFQEKFSGILSHIKGSHGDEQFDDKKFSSNTDFTECCIVVDERLRVINEKYNDELLPINELDETKNQLLQKEVSLSFYGQYNAGKSTLLNAILQNKFLPMNKDAETSLRLIIQPTSESEEHLTGTMKLSREIDGATFPDDIKNCLYKGDTIKASGVEHIHDKLVKVNHRVREEKKNVMHESVYTLMAKIPLSLQVPNGWKVSLVDNPGFDERNKRISETAVQSLKASSAYLYITTYDQYRQTQNVDFIKAMYENNNGIFKEHRFIIVVNKLDRVCHGMHDDDSDDEEELTEDDVVSKVLKFIREECECGAEDIPREAVIPVYGMWAYKARMLAREPTKASRKKKIVNILCKMYNQPVGQGENPKKILKKRSSLELSQDLEKLSKIDKVEERLQEMAKHCIFVWIEKIKNDLSKYIKTSKHKLMDRREEIEGLVRGSEITITSGLTTMESIYEVYKEIIDSTMSHSQDSSSTIKEKFKEKYEKDMKNSDPKSKVVRELIMMVKKFKDSSINEERAENYDPHEFEKDVDAFLREVTAMFDREIKICFPEMLLTRSHHLTAVDKKISWMEGSICSRSEHYESVKSKEFEDSIPVFEAPKFKEANDRIPVPNIYITLLEKIKEMCQGAIKKLKKKLRTKMPHEDTDPESSVPNGFQNAIPASVHEPTQTNEVPPRSESASALTPTPAFQTDNSKTQQVAEQSTIVTANTESLMSDEPKESGNDSTCSESDSSLLASARSTPTPKKVVAFKKATRQTEEIASVVEKLSEKIDALVKEYFEDFEKYVLETYWESYCSLVKKRLMDFNKKFNDRLNERIEDLKKDIKKLLQDIEAHTALTNQCGHLNYLFAQLETVADKYKLSLSKVAR